MKNNLELYQDEIVALQKMRSLLAGITLKDAGSISYLSGCGEQCRVTCAHYCQRNCNESCNAARDRSLYDGPTCEFM